MGVYISMEMPTSCRACHLKMNCEDCEGWECVCLPLQMKIGYWGDLLADNRREDCPLIPVPEHGRLKDVDGLMERFSYSTGDTAEDRIWIRAVRRIIIEAPTVIPGDKEAGEC